MDKNNVSKEALEIIGEIADRKKIYSEDQLFPIVCEELETMWPDELWDLYAEKAGLQTTHQIKNAISLYVKCCNWADILEENHDDVRYVSENAIQLIHEIACSIKTIDKDLLFNAICKHFDNERGNNSRSLNSAKVMGFNTTSDIMYAIDLYKMYLHCGYLKAPKKKRGEKKYDCK